MKHLNSVHDGLNSQYNKDNIIKPVRNKALLLENAPKLEKWTPFLLSDMKPIPDSLSKIDYPISLPKSDWRAWTASDMKITSQNRQPNVRNIIAEQYQLVMVHTSGEVRFFEDAIDIREKMNVRAAMLFKNRKSSNGWRVYVRELKSGYDMAPDDFESKKQADVVLRYFGL